MCNESHNYWADIGGGMIICCKCGKTERRAYIRRFCNECGSHNHCVTTK